MKFNNKSIISVLFIALSLSSCTKQFEDINSNEFAAKKVSVASLLKGMQTYVIPTQVHLNQFHEVLAAGSFSGYLANTPNWTSKFSTYNPPQDWIKAPFNDVISGIYPNYELIHANTSDPIYLALAELYRIASMHRITDTFGPIPYSKMSAAGGNTGGGNALSAPYDSQEEVYTHFITGLDYVIKTLTENKAADPGKYQTADGVYDGNVIKQIKFANSLKLRIAIRISLVNPTLAKKIAEEAYSHEIGVIKANDENASLTVSGTNPLFEQISNWGDDRAGADIIAYMNGYKDPRRAKMFTTSTLGTAANDNFIGLRTGIDVPNRDVAVLYSAPIVKTDDKILWMSAAEVTFLRAEGALRGWTMGGNAKDLYNQAIQLSFSQWGADGADAYLNNNTNTPQSYVDPRFSFNNTGTVSSIKIKWDDAANFETNLERIITQKWIANFPLSNEAWAEFRRTGYPNLMRIPTNKSGGSVTTERMMRRIPFPQTEYAENQANIRKAVQMLKGPDVGGTNLWWDVK
jgi:hypothetical protein